MGNNQSHSAEINSTTKYDENLHNLQQLEKVISGLNEDNVQESVNSTMNYFVEEYTYSYNFVVCRMIYSYFILKGFQEVCFDYLRLLGTREQNITNSNLSKTFTKFVYSLSSKQQTTYLLIKMNEYGYTPKSNKSHENEYNNVSDVSLKLYISGVNPNELATIIRNDEVERLQEISSQASFDFNQHIVPSNYERCSFINKSNVSLIDYAAFFGSVNCFKHLLLNGASVTNTGKYAAVSGNEEIIHLCIQNNSSFKDAYETVIQFHRNDIFHYLYDNKLQSIDNLTKLGIECILHNNYEILSFLINEGMGFDKSIIITAVETGDLLLAQYFLEKNPISINYFDISLIYWNKELFSLLLNNKYVNPNSKSIC